MSQGFPKNLIHLISIELAMINKSNKDKYD